MRPRSLLAAAALLAAACTPTMRLMRNQPAPLVGVWIDVERSAPGDTVLWRLAADGKFRPFHTRVRADGRIVSDEAFAPAHSQWYVRERTLCLHSRRVAWYCAPYALDTLADGTHRLRVAAYDAEFRVPARTLVRRPSDTIANR